MSTAQFPYRVLQWSPYHYVPPEALVPWYEVPTKVATSTQNRQATCKQCKRSSLYGHYGHPSDPRFRFGFPIFTTAKPTTAAPLPCCQDPITTGCTCGKTKNRIVGGTETEVNQYPWITLIDFDGAQCGGSLISDKWVLTAAHCFYDTRGNLVVTDPSKISITLGEHDIQTSLETTLTKVITPDKQILHGEYVFSTSLNDIALLRLPAAEDLTVYSPVCLPSTGADYVGKTAVVYGWGTTSFGGAISSKLLDVEVPVVSDASAKTSLGVTDAQAAVMLFAGGVAGKDSCQGDSGGPLSYDNSGKHQQIGVVSWGNGCADANKPGAYADVAVFRSWIDNQIASNGGQTVCA